MGAGEVMDESVVESVEERKVYEALMANRAVTTAEIFEALAKGMSFEDIESEFNIKRNDIVSALRCTFKTAIEEMVCVAPSR